jgi:hypothetical protein
MIETLVWSFVAAVLFIGLFAYLPGRIFSSLAKLPSWPDLHLSFGLALLALVLFFGRFFLPVYLILFLYLLFSLVLGRKKFSFPSRSSFDIKIFLVIFIGVLAQSLPYLKSAFSGSDQFLAAVLDNHDQTWHMGLVYELTHTFPPQIPGFSGQVLKNYHYFYDLLIAANVSIFKARIEVLLQLIYPLLFSSLYGLACYRVLRATTKNKNLQLLGLLLVFFTNNLSYLFKPLGLTQFESNSFLIDQPLFFLFNHQTVFSLVIVLYLYTLLARSVGRLKFSQAVLIGLVIASLSQFKIYAFLVVGLVLALCCFKLRRTIFPVLATAGVVFLGLLVINFQPGLTFLKLQPFWLVSAFTDKIIAPYLPWLLARSHQFFYLPLIIILFLLLNYHLLLLGCLVKKRSRLISFLSLTALVSGLFLFLCFQTQSPYNIIQFGPYLTVSLALLTVALAAQLKRKLGIYYLFAILLLSLPTSLVTISHFVRSRADLSPLRQEWAKVVAHLKPYPPGLTLSLVDRDYHLIPDPTRPLHFIENNLINSLAQKRAYLADEKQLIVLGIKYQDRLDQINQLKRDFCRDKALLKEAKIKYLLVADDLFHCITDKNMSFEPIFRSEHFGLYSLQVKE